MSNELATTHDEPKADDGFAVSARRRVGRGSFIKWNDKQKWVDRDGIAVPNPLLVVAVDEILRRWKDNVAEDIVDKPLPDPEEMNAAIPESEWELSVDGKPRPPWAHTVIVYLVNLETGETYTYAASTVGAHIAYDALKEAVITMRAIRGTKCMPVVALSERPMKMKYGMGLRPHFDIKGWKTLGGDQGAIADKPAPQLSGPAATTPPVSTPAQPQQAAKQAKPGKPAINLGKETLDAIGEPKPVTSEEIFDDGIPF